MKPTPSIPLRADRLLQRWCHPTLYESISGDLYEMFLCDLENGGLRKARRKYVWNAIIFLRHSRLRNNNNSKTQNIMDLLNNYLKVSVRDIRNNKVFSTINILGLVTGFTALLLILQFVLYETSFDKFYPDKDNLYRVINTRYQNNQVVQRGPITYPTIGPTLKNEYPEVIGYSRLMVGGRNFLTINDNKFMIEDYFMADQHFLGLFEFPLLYGNPETALKEPATVVLTESYARRLLSTDQQLQDLIGTSAQVNNWDFPCTITGIARDVPNRSHLQFDALLSYQTGIRLMGEGADTSWEWSDFYHYIQLEENVDPTDFQQKLEGFGKKFFGDGEVSGAVERFSLQPVTDIHLENDLQYEYARVTDGAFVRLMLLIGLLILAIAWINYVNITTSRALQRAREVGVRKVLGAYRRQLVGQFLTESFLINIIALVAAVALVTILHPVFNRMVNLPLNLSLFFEPWNGMPFILWFFTGFVLAVLLTGMYPAFLISRFTLTQAVKGKIAGRGDLVNLRKTMVIGQFTAALILISGCLAIYRQIDFMQSQDLGMDLENNLVIYGPQLREFDSTFIKDFSAFKQALSGYSGIESVTATRHMLGDVLPKGFQMHSPVDPERRDLSSNWMGVDHDFLTHFNISLRAGRSFNWRDHHTNGDDVNTVILNESALELFKFESAEQAIGETIEITGRHNPHYTIVGVTGNFHQQSLKQSIQPLLLLPFYANSQFILVKYQEGMEEKAIRLARDTFSEFYPDNYFDYYFLEEYFNKQYSEDERIGMLSAVFTFLAIVLAIMGLYGLVLITLLRNTKEIGIRKVLGADLLSLLAQYGKHFLYLILVAIGIGLPVSYWVIQRFLEDYSYSRGVEIPLLLVSALVMLVLCALTVLFQTGRISSNNPVDSLKVE